jgi:hypothetical protein
VWAEGEAAPASASQQAISPKNESMS